MADIQNIQLGPGEIYLATYGDGTYSIDPQDYTSEGFTTEKGATFSYKGEDLKVKCGNDIAIKKIFLIGEDAKLEYAQEETTLENLVKAFGYSVSDISNGKFFIGDNRINNYYTCLFETTLDTGLKAKLLLFKCKFERDVELNFQPDKVLEVPKTLRILSDTAEGDTEGALGWIMFEYEEPEP